VKGIKEEFRVEISEKYFCCRLGGVSLTSLGGSSRLFKISPELKSLSDVEEML
jgi:hypothetical protein